MVSASWLLLAAAFSWAFSCPITAPHNKSMNSSNFFIVVSPCFHGREGGGFPVLSEERGVWGNLQAVLTTEETKNTEVISGNHQRFPRACTYRPCAAGGVADC